MNTFYDAAARALLSQPMSQPFSQPIRTHKYITSVRVLYYAPYVPCDVVL